MTPRHELIRHGRELGMIEMKPTGAWGLSKQGRDFIDLLNLLRELDDRPGAAQVSSPRRQAQPVRSSRTATPPQGTRRGDDVPAAAERRGAKG